MLCFDRLITFKPDEAEICKRFIVTGRLKLLTPLIIGGGSCLYGDSDIVILKDERKNPYIPSSSITGVLKHRFNSYKFLKTNVEEYEKNKLWFWGGEYQLNQEQESVRRSCQSAVIINDLTLSEENEVRISIRDGIKINRQSGIVEQGAKFDYEIVEPGIFFDFRMEVILRKAFSRDLFKAFTNWVAWQLSSGQVALGAMTGKGFGRCQLEDVRGYEFDYSDKNDIIAWLTGDWKQKGQISLDYVKITEQFVKTTEQFKIKANFRIKHSMIIRSYSGDPKSPDTVHIRISDGYEERPVLPGTSVRGAIRARAERIINSLKGNGPEMLKKLFGWVEPGRDTMEKEVIKGRINIEEKLITPDTFVEEIQHRIRVDRFTGGVINNALFNSMPIWAKAESRSMITIEITIDDFKEWEAGLLLLVLKDLWTGDLAIGGEKNIGRGILEGVTAEISLGKERTMNLQHTGRNIVNEEDAQIMQGLVDKLLNEINGNNCGGQ